MLENRQTLRSYLKHWTEQDPQHAAIAETILAIADSTMAIAELIDQGPLAGELGVVVGDNADGDRQKALDVTANDLLVAALREAPVAVVGSEENNEVLILKPDAPLAVAMDPLDGFSNIDTNLSIGTIFSILPSKGTSTTDSQTSLLQKGTHQLAAGFSIYGPHTALVLTVCRGVYIFALDRKTSTFWLTQPDVAVPRGTCEYAINASNYRYWDKPVRAYVDDCISNDQRTGGGNFNMRWTASLVAEAFRILARGGVFLYPEDTRSGYEKGRFRQVYEANPIALIIEQAGGAATDGYRRILDLEPSTIHGRVPFVFGSGDHVKRVARYHTEFHFEGDSTPLFGHRGLFQT